MTIIPRTIDPVLLSPWMPTKACYCGDPKCLLNHRTLPAISRFDRRWLHMGGDPAQVYQGAALGLYLEMVEKEKAE